MRKRKTPEQVRSDASTKVSRLQAALNSLGDGDVEEKHVLELALSKAQKQAEEMPVDRQIEVTKDFIARAKRRMIVADEKIRLAKVALQDARDERDYDMREVPLAEARLERLQKEVAPLCQTPPVSLVSDLEAEVQRLRSQLAQMEVTNAEGGRHPPQSSTQAADLSGGGHEQFAPTPKVGLTIPLRGMLRRLIEMQKETKSQTLLVPHKQGQA